MRGRIVCWCALTVVVCVSSIARAETATFRLGGSAFITMASEKVPDRVDLRFALETRDRVTVEWTQNQDTSRARNQEVRLITASHVTPTQALVFYLVGESVSVADVRLPADGPAAVCTHKVLSRNHSLIWEITSADIRSATQIEVLGIDGIGNRRRTWIEYSAATGTWAEDPRENPPLFGGEAADGGPSTLPLPSPSPPSTRPGDR
jgi:hypothetical protein